MAITVTQADLKAGAQMAQGVERLIVLGVDWTQTPASAAATWSPRCSTTTCTATG